MAELFIKTLSLNIAAVVASPGLFAIALLLASSKNKPVLKGFYLLCGAIFTGILAILLGLTLGGFSISQPKPSHTTAIVDIVLGIVFLVMAIIAALHKTNTKSTQPKTDVSVAKWLTIGALLTFTNFDAFFFSFTAAKEVAVAQAPNLYKFILLAVNIIFFTLPFSLPLLAQVLFPKLAKTLERLNNKIARYSRYIIAAFMLIFSIYLLYQGVKILR